MHSRPNYNSERGSALAIILCFLVIFGTTGMVMLNLANARLVGVEAFEARLEAERVGQAAGARLGTQAVTAARTDTPFPDTTPAFQPTIFWNGPSFSVVSSFPSSVLMEPRDCQSGSSRDPGAPGSLVWNVDFSESLKAQANVSLTRPTRNTVLDVSRTVPVEATIWRIPAGAVNLLVSSSTLNLQNVSINVDRSAVFMSGVVTGSVSGGTAYVESPSLQMTAGLNLSNRIDQIYRHLAADLQIDSTSTLPAGLTAVVKNGVTYPAIDLGSYSGPSVLNIHGTAVSNGFALIGSATSKSPLTIVVDGPIFFVGSNRRYVAAATTGNSISIYSQASPVGDQWALPPVDGVAARDTDWSGHIFISVTDPQIKLDESWTGHTLRLSGSLHVLGGNMATIGAGAGTLTQLSIVTPDWTGFASPFSSDLRHESFLVCPR